MRSGRGCSSGREEPLHGRDQIRLDGQAERIELLQHESRRTDALAAQPPAFRTGQPLRPRPLSETRSKVLGGERGRAVQHDHGTAGTRSLVECSGKQTSSRSGLAVDPYGGDLIADELFHPGTCQTRNPALAGERLEVGRGGRRRLFMRRHSLLCPHRRPRLSPVPARILLRNGGWNSPYVGWDVAAASVPGPDGTRGKRFGNRGKSCWRPARRAVALRKTPTVRKSAQDRAGILRRQGSERQPVTRRASRGS